MTVHSSRYWFVALLSFAMASVATVTESVAVAIFALIVLVQNEAYECRRQWED